MDHMPRRTTPREVLFAAEQILKGKHSKIFYIRLFGNEGKGSTYREIENTLQLTRWDASQMMRSNEIRLRKFLSFGVSTVSESSPDRPLI